MRQLDVPATRAWLIQHGVLTAPRQNEILGGFDFSKSVYEQHLFEGEVVFQYMRNPQHGGTSPTRGSWFCLRGAASTSLAISSGLSVRTLHKFKVKFPLVALEGVAAPKKIDWSWAGGGAGGATQLFVPPDQIARLRAVAPHEV